MNKVYSLVRNATTGKWVVASELAKSRGKGGRRTVAVALGLLSAHAVAAQTVNMQNFNPLNCDGPTSCVTTVSGGSNVTLVARESAAQAALAQPRTRARSPWDP